MAALGQNNVRPKTDDLGKPIASTRVKLTFEYNEYTKKYEISEEDKDILKFYIHVPEISTTLLTIERSIRYRPFDHKQPILRWLGLKMLTIFFLLAYFYVSLLILQMALFNLILLGVLLVYFKKLNTFCNALELRADRNYRLGPFLRYIEAENLRYYRSRQRTELIGGEMGRWIEL